MQRTRDHSPATPAWLGSHLIFIPSVLMVGMFLGFILGGRAARNGFDLQKKRDAQGRQLVR